MLRNNTLSDENAYKIYQELGLQLKPIVLQDSKDCQHAYKEIEQLPNLSTTEFLRGRPKPLLTFLCAMTSTDIDTSDEKKLNALCLLIEQIYYVRNLNFIGPFSFSQNLVKWSLSGSKTLQTIDGSSTAAGSLTSLKKVIKNASSAPNACFEKGDVDIYFDNTQRVGKTGRVRENGVTPMNIATNVVIIQNQDPSNIQTNEDLKPGNWLDKDIPSSDIRKMEADLAETYMDPYRATALNQFIGQVDNEIWFDDDSEEYKDHVKISNVLASSNFEKYVCSKCCKLNDKSNSVCENCKHDASSILERSSLYDVPCKLPNCPPSIILGEVIGVNPNSRENVKRVLVKITKQCIENSDRKWIRVGSDGVPYNIASSLLDDIMICNTCHCEIDLRDATIEDHIGKSPRCKNSNYTKLFDYILLIPGAGHIELNLLRAIFSFTRHVFMEKIADLLGFTSKAAKEFIINCGNHHISWQIMQIVIAAFGQELCRTFIIECRKHSTEPSLENFAIWKEHVVNPNDNFYFDLVFKLLLGLKCFRSGVRQNNSEYMLSGRQAVAPIMFNGKHIMYQNLLLRDMSVRTQAPESVKEFIKSNESYSRSGKQCIAEGGDYITENENRALKSHLPPGVPTLKSWIEASRCDKHLKLNRKALFDRLGVTDPGTEQTSTFNFEHEVQMLRRQIRVSKILEDPLSLAPLVSLDRKLLHQEVVNFYSVMQQNYNSCLLDRPKSLLKPIFVTSEDEMAYLDVKNWTIAKIKSECDKVLDQIDDKDLAQMYRDTLKKNISKWKRDQYISFYNEIKEASLSIEREMIDVEVDMALE